MSSNVQMIINRLCVWKYVTRSNHFILLWSEVIRDLFYGRCLKVMAFKSQKDLKCPKLSLKDLGMIRIQSPN